MLDKADEFRRQRQESLQLTEKLLQSVFLDMFGDPVENPKGWPIQELGKFGIVQTGNTPPRSNKDNYAFTGLEWIKTDNIVEDRAFVNGLALSKNAHWMFDEGLWSVDEDFRIVVAANRFTENGPEALKLASFGGRHLQFDPSARLRPAPELLKRHRHYHGIRSS